MQERILSSWYCALVSRTRNILELVRLTVRYHLTDQGKNRLPVPIDRTPSISSLDDSDIFRLLVESIREYAIFVLDPQGNVVTWNPGAQSLKGYSKEDIIGKHFSKFYLPEAVQSGWPERELQLAQKEGRFSDEGWRVKKDGTVFWACVVIVPLRSAQGELTGFAKITQDMTDRRQAEEKVQELNRELRQRIIELDESRRNVELRTVELQKLSSELLQIQDEERRRLAREIHDDLGQQLAALKMSLAKHNAPESMKIVDNVISTVRNVTYLLHPPLLDDSGLRAALHWFIDGLIKRSNIQINLSITPPRFPRLAKEIETAIFRIVQESLTNVYRHSKSESAKVEIEKQADWIVMRIRDYGIGIRPEYLDRAFLPRLGVGITGMRERVRQFGGELTVSRSEPGTLVETRIPLFGSALSSAIDVRLKNR